MDSEDLPEEEVDIADMLDIIKTALAIGFTVLLAFTLFYILINSLLIYGTAKERPGFLMPWIIFQLIGIMIGLFCLIGSFVMLVWIKIVWILSLSLIIALLIGGYMFLSILALRQELRRGSK